MAKNDFGLGMSSASTAAFVLAAKQSLRLVDALGAHSALKAHMQLASSIALPGLQERVALQTSINAILPTLRMPEVSSSMAFMAGLQARAESEAATMRELRSTLISSSINQAAVEALLAHRSSLQAASDALRDNQVLFGLSSEMLRAARAGAAGLRAMEAVQTSSITAVLRGIRLDQSWFNSIVESLAAATIADLGPAEAQGVATAFEDAVVAQADAASTDAARGAQGDQLVLEELSERLYQAVLARLPPEWAGGSFSANLNTLINVLLLILALASRNSDIDMAKSDAKFAEEITSGQHEGKELLRSLLEELRKHGSMSVPRIRSVDREARVFQRPAKGAAVIAVVPEGVQVAVIGVWRRWAEITYPDPVAEVTRSGWVLKKYLE